MLLLLDGIFRTIEGASVKQLQTSLWQISGALTRSSNRSYCQATAANKHGAKAGYGVECVHRQAVFHECHRVRTWLFQLSVCTEELLLLMASRHHCKRDTCERNYLVDGTKTSVNGQK